MRSLMWRLRWKLGTRRLLRAVATFPPGAMRDDLSKRVGWWAAEWTADLNKGERFKTELKRTVATWRA